MELRQRCLFYPHSFLTDRGRSASARGRNHGGFVPGPWLQFGEFLIQITTPAAFESDALAYCGIRNGKVGSEFIRRGAVWGTILPLR